MKLFEQLQPSKEDCFICYEKVATKQICDGCRFSLCETCFDEYLGHYETCTVCQADLDPVIMTFVRMSKRPLNKRTIKTHADRLNWKFVSRYSNLDEELVELYKDKIDWRIFSEFQHMNADLMNKYHSYLYYDQVFRNEYIVMNQIQYDAHDKIFNSSKDLPQPLGHWFYHTVLSLPDEDQFKVIEPWIAVEPYLAFNALSGCEDLTLEWIDCFKEKLIWPHICCQCRVTSEFLERFKDLLIWEALSVNKNWPKKLLIEHFDKIDKKMFMNLGEGRLLIEHKGINVKKVEDMRLEDGEFVVVFKK